MTRLGIAGVIWLAAAAFAIAITVMFRIDPFQWGATLALAVAAALLGLWLITRPSALAVSISNSVAVVWIVLYAGLALQQAGELAAWTTDIGLLATGGAAGIAAYRGVATAKP
jgi:hypothetical protein